MDLTLIEAIESLPLALKAEVRERIETYDESFAENTSRARASDYRVYAAWCRDNLPPETSPIPADPKWIENFIEDMSTRPKLDKSGKPVYTYEKGVRVQATEQYKSVSTISRYLASLKYLHDAALASVRDVTGDYSFANDITNPVKAERVSMKLRAIKKRYRTRTQKQASPIRLDMVEKIVNELDDSLRDTLYKALISFAFDTMLRCSELVRVECGQIEYFPEGGASVYIAWSKTDQEGKGSHRYLSAYSAQLLKDWLHASGITEGLVFRSVARDNTILESMHKDRVARIFKKIAGRSELSSEGISAHSTRVGAAQDLMADGASLASLMVAGDWKSPAMPARYAGRINVKEGAMAELHKHRAKKAEQS